MNKRILLIGGNYFPEPTGIGKFNGEMMDWLAKNNYECTVITTYPYYPQWKVAEKYTKRSFWFKKEYKLLAGSNPIRIIRCPHFVPKSPSGLTRIISDFSFFFSAYLVLLPLLFTKRFNFVLTVAPSFSVGLLGILYKYIRGGKFLYHIQDLQIDAARDLKLIKSAFIINTLLSIERSILKKADCISTISDGMIKKVQAKCNKEITLFHNWVDTSLFFPLINKADLKAEFGFKQTDKVVLYSGAIGHKQGLEVIIHAAKQLEDLRDLKLVICGIGPYKGNLEELKRVEGATNVVFMPLQPHNRFNAFLNSADVHLVLQKDDASDLVMPSKLSAILSIGGISIVTAKAGTSLYEVMSASDMGILIEPEDKQALVNAIKHALATDHQQIRTNTRRYAETKLEINAILSKFSESAFRELNKKTTTLKVQLVKNNSL